MIDIGRPLLKIRYWIGALLHDFHDQAVRISDRLSRFVDKFGLYSSPISLITLLARFGKVDEYSKSRHASVVHPALFVLSSRYPLSSLYDRTQVQIDHGTVPNDYGEQKSALI